MLYKVKKVLRKLVPYGMILHFHKCRSVAAMVLNGFPARRMKVIAIAGTKGKTTTTNMIAKVLEAGGHKVAMLSTANFQIGEIKWLNNVKLTTPSPFYLHDFLKKASKEKHSDGHISLAWSAKDSRPWPCWLSPPLQLPTGGFFFQIISSCPAIVVIS